ncbi:MAG: tetratricopeptide repeat protein [Betaproteobacteria bacterium]
MNKLFIIAVLSLSLLSACARSEQRKSTAVFRGTEQREASLARKPVEAQAPYYQGLIEEYRAILAQDSNNFAALVALGNAYFDSGNWKKAITMYEHALLINPRDADVRADMGTAYRNLGLSDRALDEYHLVLKHEPGHLDARYNMGIVYAYDKKDYRAAIRIWQDILKAAPNYPYAEDIRLAITALRSRIKEGR